VRVFLAVLRGVGAVAAAAGCSSPPSRALLADAAPAPGTFVVARTIAAGSDAYECRYVVPSGVDAFLSGVSHEATAGTHHLLVFETDLDAMPDGGGDLVDCYAGAANPMSHARGEVYGSQARAGSFAFPAGVALPVRGGAPLLVQIHLSDAGASDLDVTVTLALTTTSEAPSTRAGVLHFDDPFIDIPAGAAGRASMRCLVPADVTLLSAATEDHARAQSVSAFVDPPNGPPSPTPFYAGLDAANPLPLQAEVAVPAGSHLRFTCAYENVTGTSEVLQGFDFESSEMCAFSGAYYPALQGDAESCALAPDGFGTGAASCAQTLACVGQCAPGSAPPPDLGLGGTPDVDPCWQRCVVGSCASASAPLFALERCAAANCALECQTAADPDCAACQAAHCPMESAACANDACGG
jgi:hypothetical protein